MTTLWDLRRIRKPPIVFPCLRDVFPITWTVFHVGIVVIALNAVICFVLEPLRASLWFRYRCGVARRGVTRRGVTRRADARRVVTLRADARRAVARRADVEVEEGTRE